MSGSIITLHLPVYRARTLALETDRAMAEEYYDKRIHEYIRFLQTQAEIVGVRIVSDQRDDGPPFSIEAVDTERQSIHDWLETQPDFWNWIPAAD